MISVVIPTSNAAGTLAATLAALVPGAVNNLVREVVLADAGSTDETMEIAEDAGARVVTGGLGAACAVAKGPWLLILRADTRLAAEWEGAARDHIEHHAKDAGYFRLALDDHRTSARLAEAWSGIRTGLRGPGSAAQGLLLPKRLYDELGPAEDEAELIRKLKGRLRPLAGRAFVAG